jgi:hypothetical protein
MMLKRKVRNGRARRAAATVAASLLCAACVLAAPGAKDRVVRVAGVTVTAAPAPQVVLRWVNDGKATKWTLYRRPAGAIGHDNWGAGTDVPKAADPYGLVSYTDAKVEPGAAYEYRIEKTANDGGEYTAYGFLLVGVEERPIEKRGKLLLIVDDRFAKSLRPELARLVQDLAGDGWEVLRHDVAAALTPPQVKELIKADYAADPANVRCVFFFGRIAVPYSGNVTADGHNEEHQGAWPADLFYGDMTGAWPDEVNYVLSTDPKSPRYNKLPLMAKHQNKAGDGKYDPSVVPDDGVVELAVGRVDMSEMTMFPATEEELLRRYLDKDHAYRHRAFDPPRRALHIDGFGGSVDGFRNFSAFFGHTNVQEPGAFKWFSSMSGPAPDGAYLWAHGAGSGQPSSCSCVGTTTDFANNPSYCVFQILFGSGFGVWDRPNSLLRAPLASQPWGLASVLGTRGGNMWVLHEMGLGRTIGECVRRSQSNASTKGRAAAVYAALMGDPTLRMYMVAPPEQVAAAPGATGGATISWTDSLDRRDAARKSRFLGYYVYRAPGAAGPFTRLTGNAEGTAGFVTGTSFTDPAPPAGECCYLVRAVALEVAGSGSYYNLSQGVPARFPPRTDRLTVEVAGGATPVAPVARNLPAGSYQTLVVPPETRPAGLAVCSWIGSGCVAPSGVGTSTRILLDADSAIRWTWSPNRDAAVAVTAPASGQNFTQPADVILLKATAADPDGLIAKVEFFADGKRLGEDIDSVYDFMTDQSGTQYKAAGQPSVATYTYAWKNVPDGAYAVTARAHDAWGGATTSAPVKFTVGGRNTPPKIAIRVPADGATYKAAAAKFNLQSDASDDVAVVKVEYFQGEKSLGVATFAPYHFWQVLAPGTYTYTAKATDNQGAATTSAPVTITVTKD